MKSAHDLSGLIRYVGRDPWRGHLDDCLAEHLGPAARELGIDIDEVPDIVGPEWEGPLWGCAFEDLLGRDTDGLNVVEEYIRRRGWNETAPVKAYMTALRHAAMSLYEVSEVVPGQSMRLTDLLRDAEPVTVIEHSATRTLRNWDRIATRLLVIKDKACISGALLRFGPDASAMLVEAFANICAQPDPEPDFDPADRDTLLRHSAPLFTTTWIIEAAGAMQPSMPELVNSDGEDIEFHRLIYPLARGVTQKPVAELLNAHPALVPDTARSWNWLDVKPARRQRKSRPQVQTWATSMDNGIPLLGDLELKGRLLSIEVNSAGRARRAAKEFGGLLAGLVQLPLTEIRTIEQVMADLDEDEPGDEALSLPSGEIEQAITAMIDRHYAQVLDEPVPALAGKTPRQMARTKAGKARVAEWLKQLENNAARAGDSPVANYSFAWMWDELGVADLRK